MTFPAVDGTPEGAPTTPQMSERSITLELAAFAAELRLRGVDAAPARVVDAAQALATVDVTDPQEFYLALRCALPVSVREVGIFDRYFTEFWRGRFDPAGSTRRRRDEEREEIVIGGVRDPGPELDPEEDERPDAIASPFDTAGSDLRILGRGEEAILDELAARTARAVAWRPSRRYRPAAKGPHYDPRRTIRSALRHGGVPLQLHRRERRTRKARIVVLCDVSRSMEPYVRLLLRYVIALHRRSARVEAFVFSTHLRRITPLLRRRGVAVLDAIVAASAEWSGGTRIGLSLSEFAQVHGRILDRHTVVFVASDGLDTGDPNMVSSALQRVRAAAGAVVWLNPLAASPSYAPRTGAMVAALPHIDLLAPGDSVAALAELVDDLDATFRQRPALPRPHHPIKF